MAYFYIITHIPSQKHYAGARISRHAHISELLVDGGYTTSSKIINDIIKIDGLSAFFIRKVKEFDSPDEAHAYETRFLTKVNARQNPNFFNGHNNTLMTPGTSEFKEMMIKLYGVENAMKSDEIKEKTRLDRIKNSGYSNFFESNEFKEMKKNHCLSTYGVDHFSKTDEYKEKFKATMVERYGFATPMHVPEIKEKAMKAMKETRSKHAADIKDKTATTNLDRYGFAYTLQDPENVKKVQTAIFEKYGVDNIAKLPEVAKKISETKRNFTEEKKDSIKNKREANTIEKHGVDHTSKLQSTKDKLKATLLEKYGVDSTAKIPGYKDKYRETYNKNKHLHKKRVYTEKTCPHCGKIGRGPNMTRHHFDNCKSRYNLDGLQEPIWE